MSKSKLFIGGRASLLGRSQHIPGTHQYQHIPLPSWRLQRRHGCRRKCNNYNLTSLLPTSGFWPSGRQSKRFANAVCSRFEFQVGLPQAHETQPRPTQLVCRAEGVESGSQYASSTECAIFVKHVRLSNSTPTLRSNSSVLREEQCLSTVMFAMPLIVTVDSEVIGRRQESRCRSGDVLSEVLCYTKMYVLNWLRWRRCNGTPRGTMEWKEWKVLTEESVREAEKTELKRSLDEVEIWRDMHICRFRHTAQAGLEGMRAHQWSGINGTRIRIPGYRFKTRRT